MTSEYHIPAMAGEAISFLAPERGGVYVDCTLGGGGHSERILERLPPGDGLLIGIDRDDEAIARAGDRLGGNGRFKPVKGEFGDVEEILTALGIDRADGFLFDLGVSSRQLDSPGRGFSFRSDAPLDMRMDRSRGATAADLVNRLPEKELERIFREYGEERRARKLAMAIERERRRSPVSTTSRLAEIAEGVIPFERGGGRFIHPATRAFMALRIAVNGELEQLEKGLRGAMRKVKAGGRIVVISYHSLEDRIVKNLFRDYSADPGSREVRGSGELENRKFLRLTKKVLVPSEEEQRANPRSRSAKMRACEAII